MPFPPSVVLLQRRTFRLLRRRDFLVWMQLFGSASLRRQERLTTSSPSSTLQPWRLWPTPTFDRGSLIWRRTYFHASSRRRRRLPNCRRPRSRSGGRSSRPQTSSLSNASIFHKSRSANGVPRRGDQHPVSGSLMRLVVRGDRGFPRDRND